MNVRAAQLRTSVLVTALVLLPATQAFSQEPGYAAMEGVTAVQTAFDFRVAEPEVALGHLQLIHSMLDDPSMTRDGRRPEIVVVFIGPSVRLVSTDRNGVAPGSKAEIAETISAMHADGVRFEICMTAAHAYDVSADSIAPEIVRVGNGWISLIGYQHRGYSMIADF